MTCTCNVIWNPRCPTHGLSDEDPRLGYLVRGYEDKQEEIRIDRDRRRGS